jgi:hypothetical protein
MCPAPGLSDMTICAAFSARVILLMSVAVCAAHAALGH